MPLTPGSRLGPYEIVAPLGAGGMGEVYRARDPRLKRDIAIKVLPSDVTSSPDRLARLEREATTVAGLNHPNIVVLYSIEEDGGTRFLTMELVEGRSLVELVTPGGLPLAQLLDLGIPLADALVAAHEKGVVHRDVKPANVMVTREGRVKVLDFGLARLAQVGSDLQSTQSPTAAPLSAIGEVMGTVPYMAPEQIRGEGVDARSDLFSFGILVYELATGRQPFAGRNSWEIGFAILRDSPPPLTSLRSDLPPDFERIVGRCLEKLPRERFQTALDVANELRLLRRTLESTTPSLHVPQDRPSIAVLPFANLGEDREQEYFADGIVAEIITGLSRIKWLFVISRNSTFTYKGKPVDVKTVGRELGVRYVLEGSVRRSGNHVRVTGELIESATARQVWADRFDGTMGEIFALQDAMTMSVIGAVEPTLRKAEIERARRKRPDSLDAYDLFLRALPLVGTSMPEDADRALELLEEAIRLEPDYAIAHGCIAWCHEQRYLRGGLHAEVRAAAREHAHAAIRSGGDDAMALTLGGFVLAVTDGCFEASAIDALDRAIALSPSSALAFGFSSIVRAWRGDAATAIEHAKIGIRLSPYDPLIHIPYVGLAHAHFSVGQWADAADAARRASQANPRFSVPVYLLAAALTRLGRIAEAKSAAVRLLELQPGFTISGMVAGHPVKVEVLASVADALRDLGLPE
jgi:serine/threonine protein kinase/tetratricopeptide (TPR) repeat protein